MKSPTQSDIARLAGVSRATVSYVLNQRFSGPITVTDDTRQRVVQVAQELGYEPDAAAVSLRSHKTFNIGITIPDLHNPHMQEILYGASQEANTLDYRLLLLTTDMRPDFEKTCVRELLRRRIDALVMLPSYANVLVDEFNVLSQRRSPVVVAGNYYNQNGNLDTVTPGHDVGAEEMMQHLIDLGHRRIGFIMGVMRKPLANERLEAYYKILRQAGISDCERMVVESGITYEDGYWAADRLLASDPAPSALLCINDVLALGAMHAVCEHGLRIPIDISVAGFDNNGYSPFLNPSLTTLNVNAHEIGRECVRLVVQRIEDPERAFEHVRIPAQLMIRDSTGPASEAHVNQSMTSSVLKGGEALSR
jgi:LacI family transcriptional regulator